MFDGNHRIRRTVNLGTSSRTSRQRQQQQPNVSSSSTSFLKSTISPTSSSTTNNQKSLLEETRRRREERQYQRLQNQSVTTIVKYYRGYKTRKITALHLQQQLDTYFIQHNDNANSLSLNDVNTLIQNVTSLLNLRYRLQLPIVQQQQSTTRQPNYQERFSNGQSITVHDDNKTLLHFVEFILKISNGRLSELRTPKSYTSHRTIRQLLRYLATVQLPLSKPVTNDEEHCLLVLEYLVGVDHSVPQDIKNRMEIDNDIPSHPNTEQQDDEQINRWKRLGGGPTFQLLIDCYNQRFQQRYEQSSIRRRSSSEVTTAGRFLSIIQQVIPQTSFGQALQGALQLAVADTIESSVTSDALSLFLRLVEPILKAISATRNCIDDNNMAVDSSIKCINQLVDDSFLLQTIEQMITESPIQLLNNALTLYKREIVQVVDANTVRRMTSLIVQLVHYCLLSSPGNEANVNQRILLTILLGRRVRGDELRLDQRQQRYDSFGAENDYDDDYIDDDYDTGDHDTGTTAVSTTAASTTVSDDAGTITTSTTMGSQSINPNISSKKHKADTSSLQQLRKITNPTTRLTRQDLQTTSKLDKQYSKIVQTFIQRSDDLYKRQAQQQQLILKLATELADPDLIVQWGRILLSSSDPIDDDGFYKAGQESYVTIVGVLLQLTTGLRSRQNYVSSFLSKLAFEQDYVSMLWKYVSSKLEENDATSGPAAATVVPNTSRQVYYPPSTYLAISVFCDLFAHSLIATKDDAFLDLYTTSSSPFDTASTTIKSGIIASDIIISIRDILYEVYWTKPVQLSDFTCIVPTYTTGSKNTVVDNDAQDVLISASRARVFLTGTKLWNSLYERWNRLVLSRVVNSSDSKKQHVICEESTWWFPKVTGALSSGNKVGLPRSTSDEPRRTARATRRRSNVNQQDFADYDDADEMSIDSYDSDDSQHNSQALRTGDEDPNVAAADAETDALAETFSDPKIARVLTCIPQSVPFDRRVKLFDSLLKTDKSRSQVDEESAMHQAMLQMMAGEGDGDVTSMARVQVEIRRDHMYEDSMRQLNDLGNSKQLKRRVRVSFINQHGTAEAGIDGGGVFKEFIDDLIKDAFSVNPTTSADGKKPNTATYQLFTVTPLQTLRINSELFHSRHIDESKLLLHYEFLGRVLGKAVYESILVEPQFCLPFLNQLLGKTNTMEDLKNYDPEYYRNLTKLLQLSDADLESLGLTFELTFGSKNSSQSSQRQEQTFSTRTIELFPGGSQKPVTKDNVIQYIHLVAHQWLNVETSKPTKSFLRGFRDLIPASWVRLFSAYELQKLISGDDSVKGIDVESLKNSMQYAAGYHPSQQIIEWFWEIVEEMTSDQQHKLLKFMTSCSRQPLLGFGSLEPAPCIQQIRLPGELFASSTETILKQTPLPTASTCMNLLKLPNYRSKELMRLKLLAAIEAGAGFELT